MRTAEYSVSGRNAVVWVQFVLRTFRVVLFLILPVVPNDVQALRIAGRSAAASSMPGTSYKARSGATSMEGSAAAASSMPGTSCAARSGATSMESSAAAGGARRTLLRHNRRRSKAGGRSGALSTEGSAATGTACSTLLRHNRLRFRAGAATISDGMAMKTLFFKPKNTKCPIPATPSRQA